VLADQARIAQVLGNILNNAAKYTAPGGTIALRVDDANGVVRIAIRDNGVGIAPENLVRVFDMFVQVSSSGARTAGGLGIGLALVRAFVEMHGGTVSARSEGLGKGSEFIVTLPVVAPPVVLGGEHSALGDAATEGLRILVADDVPDSLTSLAVALQLLGHNVRTADDGPSAVETAMAFHPDIAVLDIGMPGLTGYDVASRIRDTDWGRSSLLIALTGWGQREDVLRAHRSGFDHHMTKPADFAALRRMIDAFAAAHGPAAASPS